MPAASHQHVLLAEDDRDIRLVARLALRKAGYRVTAVANGKELLAAASVDPPDIILLDWMMPEMDGPEACARLKADPTFSDIPVIFITARSQGADVQGVRALGAAGYIIKPFDALTLGEQIRRILAPPPS